MNYKVKAEYRRNQLKLYGKYGRYSFRICLFCPYFPIFSSRKFNKLNGVQEAAGSNPVTRTKEKPLISYEIKGFSNFSGNFTFSLCLCRQPKAHKKAHNLKKIAANALKSPKRKGAFNGFNQRKSKEWQGHLLSLHRVLCRARSQTLR